jgi:hypothetical protein
MMVKGMIIDCLGLSHYSVQKTLVSAIKRSLFNANVEKTIPIKTMISTQIWRDLIVAEKKQMM